MHSTSVKGAGPQGPQPLGPEHSIQFADRRQVRLHAEHIPDGDCMWLPRQAGHSSPRDDRRASPVSHHPVHINPFRTARSLDSGRGYPAFFLARRLAPPVCSFEVHGLSVSFVMRVRFRSWLFVFMVERTEARMAGGIKHEKRRLVPSANSLELLVPSGEQPTGTHEGFILRSSCYRSYRRYGAL